MSVHALLSFFARSYGVLIVYERTFVMQVQVLARVLDAFISIRHPPSAGQLAAFCSCSILATLGSTIRSNMVLLNCTTFKHLYVKLIS